MRKPQKIRVYEYMKQHGGITSYQAFRDLRITRLSARIYDLRHEDGCLIEQDHIVEKKDGESVVYDKYFISPDNRVVPSN